MLSTYRQALHRIPETDTVLPKTAAYLRAALQDLDCTVFSPWGDSVCAFFDCGKTETVAFRSDMDALPITEQTGLPFASCHAGFMHACGHDGHMSILLNLAQHVSAHKGDCSRNVLLIFQPAEETSGGAKPICETGILTTYKVTRIYGLHLWPDLPKNVVASHPGGMMSRSAELTVTLQGRSVHLARWQEGVDTLATAAELIRRLYALAEGKPCLLRFGRMESGSARNAVSDFTRLDGSLRAFDDNLYAQLLEDSQAIAAELSRETHCTIDLHTSAGYPPVTNDPALLAQAREVFALEDVAPTYITEDFSEYQRLCPGVFFLLGTGGAPLHSPHFDFDESVLETGLRLFRALL